MGIFFFKIVLVKALSSEGICSLLGIGRGVQDVGESTNVFVRFLYYLLIVAYVFVNYLLLFIAWPPLCQCILRPGAGDGSQMPVSSCSTSPYNSLVVPRCLCIKILQGPTWFRLYSPPSLRSETQNFSIFQSVFQTLYPTFVHLPSACSSPLPLWGYLTHSYSSLKTAGRSPPLGSLLWPWPPLHPGWGQPSAVPPGTALSLSLSQHAHICCDCTLI